MGYGLVTSGIQVGYECVYLKIYIYCCYYRQTPRDSVSHMCGIFKLQIIIRSKVIWGTTQPLDGVRIIETIPLHCTSVSLHCSSTLYLCTAIVPECFNFPSFKMLSSVPYGGLNKFIRKYIKVLNFV